VAELREIIIEWWHRVNHWLSDQTARLCRTRHTERPSLRALDHVLLASTCYCVLQYNLLWCFYYLFFMKLFRTSDISVVAYCREMFQFDLPSAILKKRSEKFDNVSLNWHYIELLVKILCIFGLLFLFLHYVCFYLWVNKDEYNVFSVFFRVISYSMHVVLITVSTEHPLIIFQWFQSAIQRRQSWQTLKKFI